MQTYRHRNHDARVRLVAALFTVSKTCSTAFQGQEAPKHSSPPCKIKKLLNTQHRLLTKTKLPSGKAVLHIATGVLP